MPVIDADCHVIETEETWAYMEGKDAALRPRVLLQNDSETSNARKTEFWLFDGMMPGKRAFPPERSRTAADSAEMRDLDARFKHMDELGTDTQVIYPTVLLGVAMGARVQTQVAMCRSYNRWMAGIWSRSNGRFPWLVVPPVQDRDATLEEMEFGRANGACGLLLHGLLGDYTPVDPYFNPVFQKANDLEMPVCYHAGMYNHAFNGIFHSRLTGLWQAKVPVISAFHALALSDIPERYPRVRWGFIEAAASWVPYLLTDLGARLKRMQGKEIEPDLMRRKRFFVACQTEEDIPYILKFTGEDNLVIGSDYGHADTSSELEALQILQQREDISPESKRKIVDDNARALYGL
jgi:predicted TIM-barrel fold metal-dependent hydrolase